MFILDLRQRCVWCHYVPVHDWKRPWLSGMNSDSECQELSVLAGTKDNTHLSSVWWHDNIYTTAQALQCFSLSYSSWYFKQWSVGHFTQLSHCPHLKIYTLTFEWAKLTFWATQAIIQLYLERLKHFSIISLTSAWVPLMFSSENAKI